MDLYFKKKDCYVCKGQGRFNNYYTCIACNGLGYDYGKTPAGPDICLNNLLLRSDGSEGFVWTCNCGSEDGLFVPFNIYEKDVSCEACGVVYTITQNPRIEIEIKAGGDVLAEGTY